MMVFVLILGFAAGFLLVFGLNLWMVDIGEERRRRERDRLEDHARLVRQERARDSMAYKDLYELAVEGHVDVTAQETLWERMSRAVEQSGLRVKPAQLAMLSFVCGLLPAAPLAVLTANWILGVVVALAGGSIPVLYVARKRAVRREKLLAQLPDAFELMSRVLRAGQTIPQALQSVADEFSLPISQEFGYCYEQQNLGLSLDAAMKELARRTGLLEIKIFVMAVGVHRQAGGNISQLLDRLATVIRQRDEIRGKVKTLTAEGRLQALILLGLPFVVLFALMIVSRNYAAMLFQYPGLLIGMMVAEVLGALWMRKIINFDF
jgi:tight adherence protein B